MRLSSIFAVGTLCIGFAFLTASSGCSSDSNNGGTGGSGGKGGSGGSTGGSGGKGGSGGSTGGSGGSTGGSGGSTGGSSGSADSGATGGTSGSGGTVTYADVKPIFVAKCGSCHSATMGTMIGTGSHTLADSAADAMKAGSDSDCQGITVGACTIKKVKNGSMPFNKGCTGDPTMDASNSACLTQAEQDKLQAWVDGGLK